MTQRLFKVICSHILSYTKPKVLVRLFMKSKLRIAWRGRECFKSCFSKSLILQPQCFTMRVTLIIYVNFMTTQKQPYMKLMSCWKFCCQITNATSELCAAYFWRKLQRENSNRKILQNSFHESKPLNHLCYQGICLYVLCFLLFWCVIVLCTKIHSNLIPITIFKS